MEGYCLKKEEELFVYGSYLAIYDRRDKENSFKKVTKNQMPGRQSDAVYLRSYETYLLRVELHRKIALVQESCSGFAVQAIVYIGKEYDIF